MLRQAHEFIDRVQDRLKTAVEVALNLAETVGVPERVLGPVQRAFGSTKDSEHAMPDHDSDRSARPLSSVQARSYINETPASEPSVPSEETLKAEKSRTNGRRHRLTRQRNAGGNARNLPANVRPLKVEDAIDGSTYLARIIWSLGVAELEGRGALRPADIARMVMARSPIGLDPPNIARYIRRNRPKCLQIDHCEGSSNYYKLNEEGRTLFRRNFQLN